MRQTTLRAGAGTGAGASPDDCTGCAFATGEDSSIKASLLQPVTFFSADVRAAPTTSDLAVRVCHFFSLQEMWQGVLFIALAAAVAVAFTNGGFEQLDEAWSFHSAEADYNCACKNLVARFSHALLQFGRSDPQLRSMGASLLRLLETAHFQRSRRQPFFSRQTHGSASSFWPEVMVL